MTYTYNWLKKLSNRKYTKKERFILTTAIIPMGAFHSIAVYYIAKYLGMELSEKPLQNEIIPFLFCIGAYMLLAYVFGYYIIKFLTELCLYIFSKVKFK